MNNTLYPVYTPGSDTDVFFVSEDLFPPVIKCYLADELKRSPHYTQLLKVPVTIPNYLGFCNVPGSIPYHKETLIHILGSRVRTIVIQVNTVEGTETFHLDIPESLKSNVFHLDPVTDWEYNLYLRAKVDMGALIIKEKDSVFNKFLELGIIPVIKIGVAGKFDITKNKLEFADNTIGIMDLFNQKTKACLENNDLDEFPAISNLLEKLDGKIKVVGVEFQATWC